MASESGVLRVVRLKSENVSKQIRPVTNLFQSVFVAWLDSESIPLNVDRAARYSVAGDCKDLSDQNRLRLACLSTEMKTKWRFVLT